MNKIKIIKNINDEFVEMFNFGFKYEINNKENREIIKSELIKIISKDFPNFSEFTEIEVTGENDNVKIDFIEKSSGKYTSLDKIIDKYIYSFEHCQLIVKI